ncbi:type II toxin-antitoxin system RelE/ParE family toxin [Roseomonas mucosa]|uniref:type II toxin-antitoxin system RelE/ParE family toxin n=1 Tax=Roseomonas mucosa TaxID=207340 RepID=UPI00384E6C98
MIQSFKDDATRRIFEGNRVFGVGWEQVQKIARRKLLMLHAAVVLDDLRSPPGNMLEPLQGNRDGQHSIRVNGQWRVCFVWRPDGPHEVEVTDYH